MTRNEFIATTAARYSVGRPNDSDEACIGEADRLADSLEARGKAPWRDQPPAPSSAAMRVVEAAMEWSQEYNRCPPGNDDAWVKVRLDLERAVRAYKESVQ